ncbi:MAG TPA: nitrate reductase [Bacteroidota bacterium]|nr:nitrate reductase [Bacteroidota bacterium]
MHETRDSIENIWGERTPYYGQWPERVDERVIEEPERWVQSACVLCSNDCALDIGVKDGCIVGVRGRAVDRTNRGRLGPKGMHGWIANESADRLTFPMIRRNGALERASWDEALDLIVRRSKEIVASHTANAIGFYTSGQLFLEEYYTLGVIGKAGLGTPHMDGNTRLCTATAAASLIETFGSDGQPGSYTDIDTTEAILLVGHNMANTQTVLWSRILDRLAGPRPPKLVVIDPRSTHTAARADVHLAPRSGTNIPVLNGLINLIIESGRIDRGFIDAHTVGFDVLAQTVAKYSPSTVEALSGVPEHKLREAAAIVAGSDSLVSTCLQGVYQSPQATAAACQVNNINLIRGLIGRPGSGILQMNGQPTAQNTRETGCSGALPSFRNFNNPAHVQELARLWNVDAGMIPHWSPPTHAMQIFRFCEEGSIRMLWISATNPAVSLPELARIRRILKKPDLFVVVQDIFMTETAKHADVLLPAAMWGEKTGTFTNVDRTVHISHQAIEPPGEARSDLDIFLEYARRMDFRDKDGAPLIAWHDPESAFEAWKKCTSVRLCDYTGITYEKLTGGSGIQWPCNEEHPDGTERLYSDGYFRTGVNDCEMFGHDLDTGALETILQYKAIDPQGKAWLRSADYHPLLEQPDADYPLLLTTGRVVYHFHTRTKTGRSAELVAAAPDAYVELSEDDARAYKIADGDWVEVRSRRGIVQAKARICAIVRGEVFIPFHYGYWDGDERPRAANELTLTEWDPVSKQPYYKYAAVSVRRIDPSELAENPDRFEDGDSRDILETLGDALKSAAAGHPETH